MIDWIWEPLSYAFMQRALLMSCVVGGVCAFFSCFLVLRGWSLMGDAVSHAILPGMALAYIVSIPLALGAFLTGVFCALFTGHLATHSRLKNDALMGVVFSGMFGIGLVLLTKIETEFHLLHILFGNVLGVSWEDIWQTSLIVFFPVVLLTLKYKDFILVSFDPVQAKISGVNVKVHEYMLLVCLALVIVASLKAVGIVLVIAMLIAPGAIGFLVMQRFNHMLVLSLCASIFSCIIGTYVSFYFDLATAPLIVVFQATIFLIAMVFNLNFNLVKGEIK